MQNLCTNPSFEIQYNNFWNLPSGGYDTEHVYIGSHACKCFCDFVNGSRTTQGYVHSGVGPFTPKTGYKYDFQARIYVPSGSPIQSLRMAIADYNSWSTLNGYPNYLPITVGDWKLVRATRVVATKENPTWRFIIADPNAPGFTGRVYWWVDDVIIREVNPLPAFRNHEL